MPYAILTYCRLCATIIHAHIQEIFGVWVKAFNFQKGRIFIVFTATELVCDTVFFHFFSFSSNPGDNVKTKNYKKILKLLTL